MFYCTMSERPWEGRMMSGLCQGMQQGKVPCFRETGTTSRTYRLSLLVNVNGFGLEDGRASCRDDSKSLSFWICNEKKIFFFLVQTTNIPYSSYLIAAQKKILRVEESPRQMDCFMTIRRMAGRALPRSFPHVSAFRKYLTNVRLEHPGYDL